MTSQLMRPAPRGQTLDVLAPSDAAQALARRSPPLSPQGGVYATAFAVFKAGMSYVIDPPKQPSVAVAGSGARFPVRRIFCVGRNYADHVREMGNDPKSEPPIFFTKPADAVVESGAAIAYAQHTDNLHHEVELVVAIGKAGSDIPESAAQGCVWGYGVGVDLTRRDRQNEAKKGGQPWDTAKAFDDSAPMGALTPAKDWSATRARIKLSVNDAARQDADIAEMIWSVPEIIATLSRSWALQPGDLIFTGTPSGVGAIKAGDVVKAEIEGLSPLSFTIKPR